MNQPIKNDALVDLVASLVERDPDCEDRVGVGAILRDLNRLAGWVEARKLTCTRQLRRLEAEGRSEGVGSALIDESRHSAAEATRTLERERVCDLFAGLEDRRSPAGRCRRIISMCSPGSPSTCRIRTARICEHAATR